MAELNPSWFTVPLSDSSAVKLVGDWSTDAQSGFHNVSYPETPASAAFTFHGTRARAVGFVTLNDSPLNNWIIRSSGEPFGHNVELPACSRPGDTTSGTCPPAFYTTGMLSCDQYTLNFTVMPDQAMQIKEFDFVPCISDDDQASASATAPASASSPTGVIAAEKKQTLGAGVIVGTVLGALAVLSALGGLALFILLRRRRRRRRHGTSSLPFPSPPSPPLPSSPFFISLSRSRPWLRLPGRQPEPSNPPAEFLASASSSSPAAASRGGGGGGGGGRTGPTMFYAPIKPGSGSASASPAPAPDTTGPASPMLAGYAGDGYARGGWQREGIQGETVEKQPLRYDDAELEPDGLAFARGYLPDSKELMAWQEWEQAGARGCAQTPRATEALPRYQTRDSLRRAP